MSQSDNKQEVIYNLIISLNYKKKNLKRIYMLYVLYIFLYIGIGRITFYSQQPRLLYSIQKLDRRYFYYLK